MGKWWKQFRDKDIGMIPRPFLKYSTSLKIRESSIKFNEDNLGYCILAIIMVRNKKNQKM